MMFITDVKGSARGGWEASIYKPRNQATNEPIAIVFGFNEAITALRAQAIIEALQALEK